MEGHGVYGPSGGGDANVTREEDGGEEAEYWL